MGAGSRHVTADQQREYRVSTHVVQTRCKDHWPRVVKDIGIRKFLNSDDRYWIEHCSSCNTDELVLL